MKLLWWSGGEFEIPHYKRTNLFWQLFVVGRKICASSKHEFVPRSRTQQFALVGWSVEVSEIQYKVTFFVVELTNKPWRICKKFFACSITDVLWWQNERIRTESNTRVLIRGKRWYWEVLFWFDLRGSWCYSFVAGTQPNPKSTPLPVPDANSFLQ